MPEFVRILSKAELPTEGEAREVECGEYQLCIARLNGEVTVMNNLCPHNGGPLGEGIIENGKIVCPWHAWAFDLKTGKTKPRITPGNTCSARDWNCLHYSGRRPARSSS